MNNFRIAARVRERNGPLEYQLELYAKRVRDQGGEEWAIVGVATLNAAEFISVRRALEANGISINIGSLQTEIAGITRG